jgi:uncharacterized protein (DUF488 family)
VPKRIFTIGHGTRPVEELVDMLHDAAVHRLVDVRTAPGSRRNPQFARDALTARLEAAGHSYVWRKGLGGFRRARTDSRHVAIRNASFRGYADYMDTPEFAEALGWLEASSRATTTALMCAETLWWRCHRRMIADALLLRGWRVVHLLRPGATTEHVLHPAARVDGGGLVYDLGAQAALA